MTTNVKSQRSLTNEGRHTPFFHMMRNHTELIAALTSGAIILTTWALTDVIPHSIWITLHIIAFLIGGYAEGKEGIRDTLENKELNVELLMIIAAIGSAAIGFWTEGAILIFIFALAGALETYTLNKSNQEISALMDIQPEEALRIRHGKEETVPTKDLAIGDHIFVKASERIPADGKIIKGTTSIDESAITGESVPVLKDNNQDVFAGTVALDGSITIQITKLAHETLFQKIIDMVQTAKDEKPPTQLFIEKFEGLYVNIVLIVVVIMMFLPYFLFNWTLTDSIYRAMVLLVVASPCALVASIMPAILSTISKNARAGVLFKGGIHAENFSSIKVMAFDKTGTLTKGTPVVTDVHIHPDYDPAIVHEAVGAIESESTHPLALALRSYTLDYLQMKQYAVDVWNMKTASGQGVTGKVRGESWQIGKELFAMKEDISVPFYKEHADSLAMEGKTIVYVGHRNQIVAIYALRDTVREDAKQAIAQLHEAGIRTFMLTGDNELTAKAVAKETGINDYIAECLPGEKVEHVKRLREEYGPVAMVGDGINDAPALASADIGIAMGEGTDVALETADIILMKNDLSKITNSMQTTKSMNRIVKQNVFFSLAVIAVLIISNFFQAIDLPLGVIGHEGSTILVILNGLRLLR